MPNSNAIKVKKWYQKKKQDPDFYEEYKRKQKLYYHRRKNKLKNLIKESSDNVIEVLPDYGSANCKYCNKVFKKSRHIHYFCSRLCFSRHHDKIIRERKKILKPPKIKIPKTPEQLKLAKKQAQIKYWKKLKDQDPKKYELMLEKTRQARRKWKAANKTNYKKIKNQKDAERRWKRNKEKTDPVYRIKERLRSYLSRSIKGLIQKNSKTEKIVGTSFKNLVSYLEKQFKPGMTLSNYGKWHIDHIKPVSKFDLTKPGELEKCFHYSNLQPMWARDNIIKSNKYDANNQ